MTLEINEESLPEIVRLAHSGRVVVFDTESTGMSANDEICQLAATEFVAGHKARTMNVYVRPSCAMSEDAESVHGLSLAFLQEHGIDPADALEKFFALLGPDVLLVAHSSPFDLRMLRQSCSRCGMEFHEDEFKVCDTIRLAKRLHPEFGRYRLSHLLEVLNVEGVNSHDAKDDAAACAGVFFCLVEEFCRIS